jgi:hypothetical protein
MEQEQYVTLDLTTMEGLNDEVRKLIAALSGSMDEGDKASIAITINLERLEDMYTMFKVTHKVKPNYPSKSRQILAHADLVGNLCVDANPVQKNIFPMEVVKND